jgi:histidinol-phosphate aminotransferase
MSLVELARPEIQALHAYAAAQQVDDTIRLNANESPRRDCDDRYRRPLNRYPEVRPRQLQSALARRFGCDTDQLLVTRGSSEAIDLLVRSFCRAGRDSVVTTSPTFSMYRHYAAVQGANVIEVPTHPETDFAVDMDALLAACESDTRLVFICSPNNPTGTTVPRADLEKLLELRAGRSAVVVDEAYIEFGDAASVVDLLRRYPNLLVLRTLSKALALAGARCGAVIGQPPVIRMLGAVQSPYAMATPVVECVEDALQNERLTQAEAAVAGIVAERERLAKAIAEFDFVKRIWPSAGNFFLVQVANAQQVMQHCAERRILLRYFGGNLADCVRISVGSVTENDALLGALAELEES